jgi:hypothetical protein
MSEEQVSELTAKLRKLQPKENEPNSANTLTAWINRAERDRVSPTFSGGIRPALSRPYNWPRHALPDRAEATRRV